MLLLIAMILVGGSAWAASPWKVTEFTGTIANNSITINDATWTVKDMTVGSNANGAPAMSISSKKLKFGSSKNQFWSSYTLSTDYFKDYNVTKVVIGCYDNGGTESEVTVIQGGVTIGSAAVSTTTSTNIETLDAAQGKGGALNIKFTSTKQASYITSITVYYLEEGAEAVNVTGVSLDESSIEIEEGSKANLVATITPSDASDKSLTWESSNASVAIVTDGTVTAIAPGTATITVKTVDGGFSATCEVTVTKAVEPDEYLFLFAANGSDSDVSGSWTKAAELNKVFAEGYQYISSLTDISSVYAARNSLVNGVKMGSSKATGNISFELKRPVKATYIVVTAAPYGDNEGQQGFKINGKEVKMPVGQNKVYCEYAIKLDGSAISTIKLENIEVSGRIFVESIKLIKDDDAYYPKRTLKLTAKSDGVYYGTFSSTNGVGFDGAEGVTVSYVGVEDGSLVTYDNEIAFALGDEISRDYDLVYGVPANTGILIRSTEQLVTYYSAEFDKGIPSTPCIDYNMLRPATEAMTGDYKFYKLAYGVYNKDSKTDLGFYYGAEDGAAFTCKAGLAYLAVPAESAAKSFVLGAPATAIKSVSTTSSSAIYNLAGQRLSQPQKGINIVDGKKVLVK